MKSPALWFCASTALGLALLASMPARALKDDRDEPLQVKAASVSMDQKTGFTVYSGNVVLVQGSIHVEASKIEIRNRAGHMDTVTATGKPVRVRALPDEDEDEVKASADQLVYFVQSRELDLRGNVLFRRGGDQFNAEHMRYALDTKQLRADGTDVEDGRIYAIIQPRPKTKP